MKPSFAFVGANVDIKRIKSINRVFLTNNHLNHRTAMRKANILWLFKYWRDTARTILTCIPNDIRFFILGGIFLVCTNGFPQTFISGTTIIAARTKNKIIVGADSKGILGYNMTNPVSVCKIVQISDSTFFTAENFIAVIGTDYDAYELAKKSASQMKSIYSMSLNFEKIVKPLLAFNVQKIKQDCVFVYERKYKSKNVLNAFFFGIENGIPVIHNKTFIVTESILGNVGIKTEQRNCPPDCGSAILWIAAGKVDTSNCFRRENRNLWRYIGIEKSIEFLITMEAIVEHDYVGLPIDIIHVSRDSIYWIQRKPQCQD